jgi:hypothetical protein
MTALEKALQEPESREVVLIRSACGDTTPFTRTEDDLINAIYSAISGDLSDLVYNNEFAGGDLEHQWCHAKLTSTSFPAIDPDLTGYELTHSIMYATDFGRSQFSDATAAQKCSLLAADESSDDLFVEYLLAIKCLNADILSELQTRLVSIHGSFDLDSEDKHMLFLLALVEAYGVI